MHEYHFGGNRFKKITSRFISLIVRISCVFSSFFVRIARRTNSIGQRLRIRAKQLLQESEPITIHITRIIPLDRWTLRIEFYVNSKTKYCIHHDSPSGGYFEAFTNFKRGDEVDIIEAHYMMVSANVDEWKKM